MAGVESGSPFDDIHLGWKGQKYTILAHRVMGAIKRIEDHITLAELQRDASNGTIRLGKLASAYAEVLRYAGFAGATTDDVYADMFGSDAQGVVVDAVASLLGMMIPRNVKLAASGDDRAGEDKPRARRTARRSSKRHSS